jgi:hypothetical protein
MKRNILFNVSLISLFFVITVKTNVYCQEQQVNYCTNTRTSCAIPSCIDEKEITDLDRVKMMYDDLFECKEEVIRNNKLTVTTYYPQEPRYENDYQYMVGKSVTSVEGMFLYDHKGNEITFVRNEGLEDNFIIPSEYVKQYGIYNQTFKVDRDKALNSLKKSGFEVYEEGSLIVALSKTIEITVDLDKFIFETRFFDEKDRKLQLLHRTNYMRTGGYIVPVSETEVTYDILPSREILCQITRVKTYLSYQVLQDGKEIINEGEKISYKDYDFRHKSMQNGGEIDQFEEIQYRETEIKVFPNPATDYITLVLPFYMNENIDITILNTIGIVVLSQHYAKGEQIDIDIHSLPAGVYVVRCIKNHKVISTRFVKQ